MAELSLRGAIKRYGDTQVVHGIDLDVSDGEFVVVVGPSGCGKSTLLRMVAGLETVSDGEIVIDGTVVNEMEPKDRDIAMVFQNYALYPHMSVYDNMAYGLRNLGTAKLEIERRVREAARVLEIRELLARKPRQLSGGQRQRVAMGRAIVREPAVFLFDEPLSNLDAKLRVQMRIELKRLQRNLGTTSLYVTHDQVEAMTMADRLVVMNAGIAEQVGTPLDVYARPATIFVAGFIGSPAMNLVEAAVTGDGGLELAGAPAPVRAGLDAALAGREVTLGVRPEHIELGDEAGLALGTLAVELVEPLGADTLVHGRIHGEARITVRAPGVVRYDDGRELPLSIAPGDLHLFDPVTGRAIT